MDSKAFIEKLDSLFSNKQREKVEPFLLESLKQAREEGDDATELTILNEMIGFYRDAGLVEKDMQAVDDCKALLEKMGLEGTIEYATSMQNIANAYRAAGKFEDALAAFDQVFEIYDEKLDPIDYNMASLHNNVALLYQEMDNFEKSVGHLKKALAIIEQVDDAKYEFATTYANLGTSLLRIGEAEEAEKALESALEIFEKDEVKNFHYSAALSALAAVKVNQEKYDEALPLYEEALKEIEINMGKESGAYKVTEENYNKIKEMVSGEKTENKKSDDKPDENDITGLKFARDFYEEYGAPMIKEQFSDYENLIAVGLVGEGSERFGFDDEYSMDHDFGPGFCMWVSEETYDEIGEKLQTAYETLPKTYEGVTRVDTQMAEGRVGVQVIGDFYEKYTGYRKAPTAAEDWAELEDYKLATVTNGEVFRDDIGTFSQIREGFLHQPEAAKRLKLARCLSAMAQMGQANYPRSMARKDYVTAEICIAKFMEETMKCLYILNDKYAPYYKWLLTGTKTLEILPEVGDIMRALADMPDQREAWEGYTYDNTSINENDQKALIIEIVAKLIIGELQNQGYISEVKSNFLNDYVYIYKNSEKEVENEGASDEKPSREEMMEEIIKLEFEAFDKVENEGGRASCQDDWPFFYVMRKSQYMTWTDEMLEKLLNQWRDYKKIGWNMMTEKYGRMMQWTDPKAYKKIAKNFPERSEQTKAIIDQIAEIQVGWMSEFAKEYPKLANQARDITAKDDEAYNTSYETYLKGELMTYSDELIALYGQFIVKLAKENKNLAYMTIENTAHMQGYDILEQAEASLE